MVYIMTEEITKTQIKKTLKTIKKIIIPEEQAQKEWNLSDKVRRTIYLPDVEVIEVDFIKEFIKRLKDEWQIKENDGQWLIRHKKAMIRMIDKLAGDKLK